MLRPRGSWGFYQHGAVCDAPWKGIARIRGQPHSTRLLPPGLLPLPHALRARISAIAVALPPERHLQRKG